MTRVLLFLLGLLLYFAAMAIVTYYGPKRKTADKLGRRISERHEAMKALPDRHRKRIEKSLFVLERHPDLRNGLGASVTKRYADQIAAITQRYAKASQNESPRVDALLKDGHSRTKALEAIHDEGSSRSDVLLEEGLGTIERKIERALQIKGGEAQDELDIYVRFLREAD